MKLEFEGKCLNLDVQDIIGLLINFGGTKLQFKHLFRKS